MQRGVRTWMTAALVVVLGAAPALAETLLERVDRMERELKELRGELRRREQADRRRDAEAAKAKMAPPAPVAPVAPVEAATAGSETKGEPAANDAALRAITERVRLGGYGSIRYEGSSLDEQKNTFTYRRFVLTADAAIASGLRAYMELEFERFRQLELEKQTGPSSEGGIASEQAIEGTSGSEIALEQAWVQYDIDDMLKLRAGEVLVPLGRFNLNHDDNRWDIARRPLVDRGVPVLPAKAAWGELGVGFVGDIPMGESLLSYQGYVVNGVSLDTEFEQVIETRKGDTTLNLVEAKIQPGTGTFGSDVKDAKAGTGRLAWSPRLGHEIAASGYFGQYTPDFLGNENLWALAADGRTGYGPFEL
ncbi:MAG: hypothetical protein ACREQL_00010, partial [Candidatus Binatia bacterium]